MMERTEEGADEKGNDYKSRRDLGDGGGNNEKSRRGGGGYE